MRSATAAPWRSASRSTTRMAAARTSARELLASIAPMVDLFNVTIADYSQEMGVSRFVKEGSLEPASRMCGRSRASPWSSVGRFTSPETMLSPGEARHRRPDRRGAALDCRSVPAAEDPRGPEDDIRECIGCNICYALRRAGRRHPLHAEPHDGRGMAARLASGEDCRGRSERAAGAGDRRRAGGTRGRADAGQARA